MGTKEEKWHIPLLLKQLPVSSRGKKWCGIISVLIYNSLIKTKLKIYKTVTKTDQLVFCKYDKLGLMLISIALIPSVHSPPFCINYFQTSTSSGVF